MSKLARLREFLRNAHRGLARLFSPDSIRTLDVVKAVLRELEAKAEPFIDGKDYVPNRVKITLVPADDREKQKLEAFLTEEMLQRHLEQAVRSRRYELRGRLGLTVELEEPAAETPEGGRIYAEAWFEKPSAPADRKDEPAARTKGDQELAGVATVDEKEVRGTAKVVCVQGGLVGQEFKLKEKTSFGRDPNSDIIVNEETVSRHHAHIAPDERGRYFLYDHDSKNGVYVNGKRVNRTQLSPGDRFQLGQLSEHVFEFVAGPADADATRTEGLLRERGGDTRT